MMQNIEQIRNEMKKNWNGLISDKHLSKNLFEFVAGHKAPELDARIDHLLTLDDESFLEILSEMNQWLPLGNDYLGHSSDAQAKKMFFQIYYLYVLRIMATTLEWGFFELIIRLTAGLLTADLRLKFLEDFQRLLSTLDISYVITIKEELEHNPYMKITNLIQLDTEYFHLYEALLYLTQQPVALITSIYESTYSLDNLMQMLIVRLTEIGLESTQDLLQALLAEKPEETKLSKLVIIREPPPQCVYRRNLNPNPVVAVEGDMNSLDGKVTLNAVLVRCDTLAEVPNELIGDISIAVNTATTYTFEKLRIKSTSRQLGDTHVCVRFELRAHEPKGSGYKVLDTLTSRAISVVSHTSLLKKKGKPPVISEVVPSKGPTFGNSRIAILGSGFADTPLLRVKVGDTLVKPIFHGEKTLIITTPVNVAGPVEIQVSNGNEGWSTPKIYSYYEESKFTAGMNHTFGTHSQVLA